GRGEREDGQSRVVDFLGAHSAVSDVGVVETAGGVGKESDEVVAEHGVSGGGVAAVLRGGPGDDDGGDPIAAQDDVEVRAEEPAVAVLLDDRLPGSGASSG